MQSDRQYLGRHYAGCGATVGAMPRCDFACRGCYLGADSNRTPRLPLDRIEEQLDELRRWLGPGGNLQLTDGEVSLLPDSELLALIRSARERELLPMLMTHGDGFLRDPSRLEMLMRGGLGEISFHIDSTQRGRRDRRSRYARTEADLMALREAFASLVRGVRKRTSLPLEVASTVTVSRENLAEVSDIVGWVLCNADAFKIVSFQPVASVGRTEAGLAAPVSVEGLWEEIEKGLGLAAGKTKDLQGWFGDPRCSRFVQGLAVIGEKGARFVPLIDFDDARDSAFRERLLGSVGGLSLRLDAPHVAIARCLGLGARNLYLLPAAAGWARRMAQRIGWNALRGRLLGRTKFHYLNVVSHHFMNARELATETGRERLSQCAFKVVIDGQRVSMCEANAGGVRELAYEKLRAEAM